MFRNFRANIFFRQLSFLLLQINDQFDKYKTCFVHAITLQWWNKASFVFNKSLYAYTFINTYLFKYIPDNVNYRPGSDCRKYYVIISTSTLIIDNVTQHDFAWHTRCVKMIRENIYMSKQTFFLYRKPES